MHHTQQINSLMSSANSEAEQHLIVSTVEALGLYVQEVESIPGTTVKAKFVRIQTGKNGRGGRRHNHIEGFESTLNNYFAQLDITHLDDLPLDFSEMLEAIAHRSGYEIDWFVPTPKKTWQVRNKDGVIV